MLGILALTSSGILAGCAAVTAVSADLGIHESARTAVADVSRGLYRGATDVIDDYARWAYTDTQSSAAVELIGFEAYPNAVHGEPFGALRFRATVPRLQSGEPYVACFESEFNYWGVATEKFGDWDEDAAVAQDIECPLNAERISPPVDTRTVYVVPDGAEPLAVEVLTNASPTESADEILREVIERMPTPTGEREVAFEPRVIVIDSEIGFAMGDADECLLVKRGADGVQILHVPDVLLQPGELGCAPDTALRPLEQLQPPH